MRRLLRELSLLLSVTLALVACGGSSAEPMMAPTAEEEVEPEVGTEEAPVDEPDEGDAAAGVEQPPADAPPRAVALDPSRATAGEPLILTVTGEGFADGALVRVLANAVAGTAQTPRYEMVEFPADCESQRVLLVDFDRGFAPSPRLRRVVVVNPDGASSAPLFLEIVRRSQ